MLSTTCNQGDSCAPSTTVTALRSRHQAHRQQTITEHADAVDHAEAQANEDMCCARDAVTLET